MAKKNTPFQSHLCQIHDQISRTMYVNMRTLATQTCFMTIL